MTIKDDLTTTFEGLCEWHQERSILETSEMICEIMKELGVSRVELAEKLHKSKGFISQLLGGSANMTIRTISDIFVALGHEFHPAKSRLTKFALDIPLATSTGGTNAMPNTEESGSNLAGMTTLQFTFSSNDKSLPISVPYSKSA